MDTETPHHSDDGHFMNRFECFKVRHSISTVIAISGGADNRLPGLAKDDPVSMAHTANLKARFRKVVGDCLEVLCGHDIAIMCGGTNDGVPEIAAELAREMEFKLIYVTPSHGMKYRNIIVLPDLDFEVPPLAGSSRWGDESPLFAQLLDGMLVVGGATGTLVECAHVFKINESLVGKIKPGQEGAHYVKYVVPLKGFGGVSEQLHHLCFREPVRALCMPLESICCGKKAGELLLKNINPQPTPKNHRE